MHLQRLGDDLADGHARVQAGVRVLEDHLHPPAHLAQVLAFELDQVNVIEIHVTGGRPVKLQDSAPGGRFSAARLAHQPKCFPFINLKRYAIDRVHHPYLALENTA